MPDKKKSLDNVYARYVRNIRDNQQELRLLVKESKEQESSTINVEASLLEETATMLDELIAWVSSFRAFEHSIKKELTSLERTIDTIQNTR